MQTDQKNESPVLEKRKLLGFRHLESSKPVNDCDAKELFTKRGTEGTQPL